LTVFSDKTQVRYVREIILARREIGDFGRLRQTGDNARKFNLVCDDRNPWLKYKDVEICRWVEYGLNQSKMNWDGQISPDSISRY